MGGGPGLRLRTYPRLLPPYRAVRLAVCTERAFAVLLIGAGFILLQSVGRRGSAAGGTAIATLRVRKSTMIDLQNLRRCRECETVFEPDVGDRDPSGEPRCPQCFLSSSDDVLELDQREMVIRQSTPFR